MFYRFSFSSAIVFLFSDAFTIVFLPFLYFYFEFFIYPKIRNYHPIHD